MVYKIENLNFEEKILCQENGLNENMLMDVSIQRLKKGDVKEIFKAEKEVAVLLIEGKIKLSWILENGDIETKTIQRQSIFDENPSCLHVSKSVKINIESLSDCEVLIQSTSNQMKFKEKFYSSEDCISVVTGEGTWNGTARRIIRTIFDYNNAPYSNMVMGEVITYPGKWSSYPPHYHPQPEVYYYKFDKPQGFGFALIGDDAFKIKDNSFAIIPGGLVHPQTSAPGYAMYYCWMIRHLDNNPWTERIDDKDHKWLFDKDADKKIWNGK